MLSLNYPYRFTLYLLFYFLSSQVSSYLHCTYLVRNEHYESGQECLHVSVRGENQFCVWSGVGEWTQPSSSSVDTAAMLSRVHLSNTSIR